MLLYSPIVVNLPFTKRNYVEILWFVQPMAAWNASNLSQRAAGGRLVGPAQRASRYSD